MKKEQVETAIDVEDEELEELPKRKRAKKENYNIEELVSLYKNANLLSEVIAYRGTHA